MTQPVIKAALRSKLAPSSALTLSVREAGFRRTTSHIWYASEPTASVKKTG
jgi:hypothetical protein